MTFGLDTQQSILANFLVIFKTSFELFIRLTQYFANLSGLYFVFRYSEGMKPFERVIQPEEWWLYKNPKIENQVFSTMKLYVKTVMTT